MAFYFASNSNGLSLTRVDWQKHQYIHVYWYTKSRLQVSIQTTEYSAKLDEKQLIFIYNFIKALT